MNRAVPGPGGRPVAGAAVRRRARIALGLILAEILLTGLVACGGGGDDSGPVVPLLPWPRLRRGENNAGLGISNLTDNEGMPRQVPFSAGTPSGYPVLIGRDQSIYLAMEDEVVSIDASDEGNETLRWRIDACRTGGQVLPLRRVTSLALAANGRDLIIGTTDVSSSGGGYIFRFQEAENGDDPPPCVFAFPVGSRSSAIVSVDALDLELLSFIIGTSSGRLTSINSSGARRWSFPENEPFVGSISSSPAVLGTGYVFASPDGRLHSVDQSGRSRWTTVIGGIYPPEAVIPSPGVLDQVFSVNAEGDVVAVTPSGTRLWTFETDAPVVGSVAVSALATEGGVFLGQNVVFALDRAGTLYGIGSLTGELVRFCEADNRACLPSTCEGETECFEVKRCEDTTTQQCGAGFPDCPPGESCTDQFFCGEEPDDEGFDKACGRDFCVNDDSEEDEDGLCKREAKVPLTLGEVELASSPILSTDSFVIAATTDGRICARRLDGSVPDGTCAQSGDRCTPQSCGPADSCCDDLDPAVCKLGYCRANPDQACTDDTCDDGEGPCMTVWNDDGAEGCIDLGDAGDTTLSAPVIDTRGSILVNTEKGLAIVE